MSFGFLGIQFGFALQGGFMTRIFQTLGADKQDIPLLWIAAPLTGLLVQPIIGYMSDRTWHKRLGRRRPYFLIGAILSSVVLFFVPHSPTLWVAAGCLWILDASINISMEPFRALVADKLDESQRSYGFIVQTLIIGIGTWVASNLPWFISKLGVSDSAPQGVIPMSVKIAFMVGAAVFLLSIIYTIITTSEYPPENLEDFEKEKKQSNSLFKEIWENIVTNVKFSQGYIHGLGDDVSIVDRFFVGGSNLRGFKSGGIGPRDVVTDDALGGNMFYTGTAQVKFPLSRNSDLPVKGLVFTQIGSLTMIDSSGDNLSDIGSPRFSIGFGTSWQTPVGPLSFSFATPLTKADSDKTETFRFKIGTTF